MEAAARLCIIGGLPRAGTRNLADLCNAHPEIRIHGEIRMREGLAGIQESLEMLEKYHRDSGRSYDKFMAERAGIVMALYAMYSKAPGAAFGQSDLKSGVVGFKSPRIFNQWKRLVKLFGDFEAPRVAFFCCRNIDENYLSHHTLGWKTDPKSYLENLRNWLRHALEFGEWARGSRRGWEILPVHLNEYIASEDKGSWLVDRVYRHLVSGVTAEKAESYIAGTRNRNATLRAAGKPRREQLTDDERRAFEKAGETHALVRQLNELMGVDVKVFSDE